MSRRLRKKNVMNFNYHHSTKFHTKQTFHIQIKINLIATIKLEKNKFWLQNPISSSLIDSPLLTLPFFVSPFPINRQWKCIEIWKDACQNIHKYTPHMYARETARLIAQKLRHTYTQITHSFRTKN